MASNYKQLKAWQKAIELCKKVYSTSKTFPADERFGLTSQIRRAAVSIAANIAEGAGRYSPGEFARFLGIARGSAYEVETHLTIASELGYITKDTLDPLDAIVQEVCRLIIALHKSVAP